MSGIFLDTSSLVKAYHREEDSDSVLDTLAHYDRIFLSEIAKIEFASAFYRKLARGEATATEVEAGIGFFEDDHAQYHWIKLDAETVLAAKGLLKIHGAGGLRTLDAIQLAAAVSLKGTAEMFMTADKVLRAVFRKEGLPMKW
jgi:predicted nucleic acid-binding protein